MSDELLAQLKRHEGLRMTPYYCTARKLTIGYGRNLEDVGISQREAEMLLKNDIDVARTGLLRAYPWVKDLSPVRQDVLVNMAFNLGLQRLSGFKKTLRHIEAGRYADAAEEMLNSQWARQVGNRAQELAEQMREGRYRPGWHKG